MDAQTQIKYDERFGRIKTAVDLKEGDRVPFFPKIGGFYANGYGLNMYDMMKDLRTAIPCIKQYLIDYEPDMAWPVVTYPIDPVEALEATYIRTPGPTHNLPLTASFQFIDNTYMQDDEFDEFLLDPTHFILTKLLPRKYKRLDAFPKLNFREIYDQCALMDMSVFADDDLKKSLYALVQAGEFVRKSKEQGGILAGVVRDAGFPLRGGTIVAPFDAYADSLRGLLQAAMDVYERPDEVLAVVDRIAEMNVEREVKAAKLRGDYCTFIPLHAGVDEFMSPAAYEKFYWPSLKRVIEALVREGIVPYVFCEGRYNTRLQTLCDVPKGKVIYMFEQVDIAMAKKTVGQVACICGNLPTTQLIFGTKRDVEDATKRMLDICAPGGGFIMDCSIIIDDAKHENMQAWRETTLKYGCY